MTSKWPSKTAREIAVAIVGAGGDVELMTRGRLKVTGPAGVAIVGASPGQGRQMSNTLGTIKAEAGLDLRLRPQKAATGAPRRRRAPRPAVKAGGRTGTLTRWKPGEAYGLLTDSGGATWFVPRGRMPDWMQDLPEGTPVAFRGSPQPRPGTPYPWACHMRLEGEMPSIKCPRCGRISRHPDDVREGYCGNCHDWTSPRCQYCDRPVSRCIHPAEGWPECKGWIHSALAGRAIMGHFCGGQPTSPAAEPGPDQPGENDGDNR